MRSENVTVDKKLNDSERTDILIVGSGCSGLYCALQLPRDKQILIITKSSVEDSDSFLAQGGMCMLRDESDYESYFEDTLRAGHYENDRRSVEIMIRSSQDVVKDLLEYGAEFQRDTDGSLAFTREGAHSEKRILFHADITGKEITSRLLAQVRQLANVRIMEHTAMLDIISDNTTCFGAVIAHPDGTVGRVLAKRTVLATGGIGGLYHHSTNFRHLTGDALAVALRHRVELENIDYIQIHPTTLYAEEDRSYLISESVRGEGAKLYDKNGNRFVDELLPRDLLTEAIYKQMEIDGTEFVWEDLRTIPKEELQTHFPNIVEHCRKMGYDVTRECIPVVPAQHYFMGGVKVDYDSKTSMEALYAVGETACNGVHGKNRLASNSLLESLVFAKRAAKHIADTWGMERESGMTQCAIQDNLQKNAQAETEQIQEHIMAAVNLKDYRDAQALESAYQEEVRAEIARIKQRKDIG
ncbi:L-aspartate oxidase [Hespellia stercorisuis]|uniref:L-aspartate oxidase n=1 Tax=Hespellia stercorisuis DSM 15480 TaxID=1121950 RepID=A0A1M6JNB0_9FIRM|nr:L-aspartate oxidase [Hespellia stercorisuis]SHJ48186.1 L-aspartate oxidase [Hespellia stercorisuis DSM 15480]